MLKTHLIEVGQAQQSQREVGGCGDEGETPLSLPSSFAIYGRAGLGVMRVGELSMSHTGYNTQDSGTCTLPGQQGSTGPGSRLLSQHCWHEILAFKCSGVPQNH